MSASGKVVIVTGGAMGIGYAIAEALAAGVKDFAVRTRALGREMYPADLTGAVAFFIGDDSAFIHRPDARGRRRRVLPLTASLAPR